MISVSLILKMCNIALNIDGILSNMPSKGICMYCTNILQNCEQGTYKLLDAFEALSFAVFSFTNKLINVGMLQKYKQTNPQRDPLIRFKQKCAHNSLTMLQCIRVDHSHTVLF